VSKRFGRQLRRASRAASANTALVFVIGSVVAVALLSGALLLLGRSGRPATGATLTLYCAAGLRPPVERIVEQYARECGGSVRIQYGGSNTLLGQIEAGKVGDLFLAADESYVSLARQRGLAAEILPVATMHPVIGVRRGNPRGIARIEDLLRKDLRVGLANPDQAAIGKVARDLLEQAGQWEALNRQVTATGVFKPTVTDLANDVLLGSVDAAILWDVTVRQYPELEAVRTKTLDAGTGSIAICVLTTAQEPAASLHFARYLASSDRGLPEFASLGYEPVEGDVWSDVPQITFFIGSVNRRALEDTIKEFQAREGVAVSTVYNGCGILTAQMHTIRQQQSGGFPDAYMACDVYYLENVKDWFQEAVNVSETEIVMVVQKGNPKGIQSLKDLARPGIRVVVGQPEQCTIGALTRLMLQKEGMHQQVMANVVSQTATSAMLVPAVTTASADVALAYATDAKSEAGRIDAVRIQSSHTKAIQPFAIARSSPQKHLARRLFQAIARSDQRFAQAGFSFCLEKGAAGCPWSPGGAPAARAKETP